jgi:bifunctional DNA-binding transcriptional regulator/antitoxin component of YhaV-PrlF toxin-antitoxin module
MADKQIFEATLEKHEKLDATGITLPFDVEAVFGAKRVPVKVLINGAQYRGSVVRMGGKYMMGVPKVFRAAAGIEAGDNIVVTMELDAEPRTVETPPDLEKALKQSGLQAAWEKLSYTHRKEHVLAIEESKKAETRARRIGKAIEMIAATVK